MEYRMDQLKGEDFRKSLGIMIGEFADVHKAQDPAVAQSMMIALLILLIFIVKQVMNQGYLFMGNLK